MKRAWLTIASLALAFAALATTASAQQLRVAVTSAPE